MKNTANLRIRRLDRRNIVVERRILSKKEGLPPKRGRPKREESEVKWAIVGYFSSLKSALLSALNMGYDGEDIRSLLKSVEAAVSVVTDIAKDLKKSGIQDTDGNEEISEDGDSKDKIRKYRVSAHGQSDKNPETGKSPDKIKTGSGGNSSSHKNSQGDSEPVPRRNGPVRRYQRRTPT